MKYLIVGLGNIGIEYHNTRHNIGFEVLEAFAQKENCSFEIERYACIAKHKIKNKIIYLAKPSTYMNLSGKAVRYWLKELKIPLENMLVIVDDIALPTAQLRLRKKGSEGGHNGLLNITELIGNNNFNRMRFGVGNNFASGKQVDYVLGKWSQKEREEVDVSIQLSIDAIKSFIFEGMNKTMNKFNQKIKN